jgi:hypothetical protein
MGAKHVPMGGARALYAPFENRGRPGRRFARHLLSSTMAAGVLAFLRRTCSIVVSDYPTKGNSEK